MQVDELLGRTRDAVTVRRVFGEAIERDGAIILPAARVAGGAGGGGGAGPDGESGEGGGFAVSGRPAGVYVIRDGDAVWRPAVDVNNLISSVAAVIVVWLVMRVPVVRARARRRQA